MFRNSESWLAHFSVGATATAGEGIGQLTRARFKVGWRLSATSTLKCNFGNYGKGAQKSCLRSTGTYRLRRADCTLRKPTSSVELLQTTEKSERSRPTCEQREATCEGDCPPATAHAKVGTILNGAPARPEARDQACRIEAIPRVGRAGNDKSEAG